MSATRGAHATQTQTQTLRIRAVFHELDQDQAEWIAAEMIARAHELANLPECECDVDVNVESTAAGAALTPITMLTPGEPLASAHRENATGAAAPSTR